MTDDISEEARRQAFIKEEKNLGLAADDLAEGIRDLLRALAAKDPFGPASRAIATLKSIFRVYGNDLPVPQVLSAAIAKLTDIDAARLRDGAIADSAQDALGYFAELTATDEMAHLRIGKAHDRYSKGIRNIDEINMLRRCTFES